MSRELIDDYTRLLTVDTRACADLFARDAEFRTRMGSQELRFHGRHDILCFLYHVPRQISFRTVAARPEGVGYSAEILVLPDGLPPRTQLVRYEVDGGRFTRFHLRPANGSELPRAASRG
ncbi:MAG: hypothetical protein IPJ77_18045 [Planctomycetes bacterium]|nr:hypothetical protein [Planctomycetota bacterium]